MNTLYLSILCTVLDTITTKHKTLQGACAIIHTKILCRYKITNTKVIMKNIYI